jgi:hypothetical protein
MAARLLETRAAGVGNACSLSVRGAPRLGRQARGKRAFPTIALRHDERQLSKMGMRRPHNDERVAVNDGAGLK